MSRNGYLEDYSMSRNAADAYMDGEMPLSKWTKGELLDRIAEVNAEKSEYLKHVPLNILQEKLLKKTGWHHTSKMFNRTDFYEIDENVVNDLTIEDVKTWMEEARREKKEKTELKPVRFSADVNYLEWNGSRKHPRASEHRLVGVMVEERGCFYYIYDQEGHYLFRKKIESKGTNVTRKSKNA